MASLVDGAFFEISEETIVQSQPVDHSAYEGGSPGRFAAAAAGRLVMRALSMVLVAFFVLGVPVARADPNEGVNEMESAFVHAAMVISQCDVQPECPFEELPVLCVFSNGELCHVKYCFFPTQEDYVDFAQNTKNYDLPEDDDLNGQPISWSFAGFGVSPDESDPGLFGRHELTLDPYGHTPGACA